MEQDLENGCSLPDYQGQLLFLPIINTPLLFIAPLQDGIIDLSRPPW